MPARGASPSRQWQRLSNLSLLTLPPEDITHSQSYFQKVKLRCTLSPCLLVGTWEDPSSTYRPRVIGRREWESQCRRAPWDIWGSHCEMLLLGPEPHLTAQNHLVNCAVEYCASGCGDQYVFNPIKTHILQYCINNTSNNNKNINKIENKKMKIMFYHHFPLKEKAIFGRRRICQVCRHPGARRRQAVVLFPHAILMWVAEPECFKPTFS